VTITRSGSLTVEVDKVRMQAPEAARIGAAITGSRLPAALDAIHFRPATRSAELAAVLDRAAAAARTAGRDPAELVVEKVGVADGEAITRLRRMAHGVTDWITTPTLKISVTLAPAVLPGCGAAAFSTSTTVSIGRRPRPAANPEAVRLRDSAEGDPVMAALSRVIDPDLGVNIVDLGFIRGIDLVGRTLRVVTTLTNPFCPLTTVIEDQIDFEVGRTGLVDRLEVEWTFDPPWSPEDVSEAGRAELREIGFATL
jgi:metal-sulfur cluster biosynthetic enzyme/ribosomal protein L22